ncbi:hypothetical protein D5086_008778 [Populus alba]|uniref:Uncharacterized protein n=1 Tax=Populus alba TaxID=43335 RepID=A0ACC4CHZ7_POPAL
MDMNCSNVLRDIQEQLQLMQMKISNMSNQMNNLSRRMESIETLQDFGHISYSYHNKALFIEGQKDIGEKDNCDDKVYEPNPNDFQDLNDEEDESNLLGCVRSLSTQIKTTRLSVVRCALTQPKGIEDWRRTAIFYTYIKCEDKGCKIIIDNGSCINAVSSSSVSRLGLKYVPHPKPYRVFWVND